MMPAAFSPLLAAARQHLGKGKKNVFSLSKSLHLAAEVLAVDSGLKPAFLYDHSSAGIIQLQDYLHELHFIGFIQHHLHLLDISDNIILVNVENTVSNLESSWLRKRVVDISSSLTSPVVCEPGHPREIEGHILELLHHLTMFGNGTPGTISTGTISNPKWNLCTIFGLLLGYPVPYWFDTDKGFENCLALTPLRIFTVQVLCPKISDTMQFKLYSFSVPDSLHLSLKEHMDVWNEKLKNAFSRQRCFTDLSLNSHVTVLAAVAL
ncbi:UPF0739 protein C1orf74 homolog [Ambystoma mexicanum]|uniref:UPF0739 protein C1orf74 homolog n=1 Tax=Ambystoma mexicanum TaxID=8296 RepID=UPI0037E9B64F